MVQDVDKANPEDFIHLFLNNSERLVEFLEHLVKTNTKLVHYINSFIFILTIQTWYVLHLLYFIVTNMLMQVEYFGLQYISGTLSSRVVSIR